MEAKPHIRTARRRLMAGGGGKPLRVGLVMLQGARSEHAAQLAVAADQLGLEIEIVPLRAASHLAGAALDAVVLPGGESTTMRRAGGGPDGLLPALFEQLRAEPSLPVLGTCAGCILLADPGDDAAPLLDLDVERNAYGRQAQSFQGWVRVSLPETLSEAAPAAGQVAGELATPIPVRSEEAGDDGGVPGVFIRAPGIASLGPDAEAIAWHEERIVGARQGRRMALTFHPELTADRRFHRWLLAEAAAARAGASPAADLA